MKIKILHITLFFASSLIAQNVNIIPQLKKVESGEIESVKRDLVRLKQENQADPNIIFLEGVITEDGEKSQKLYEAVFTNFPNSQFADAALFRSFSYFYALGLYKKAEELKTQLQKEYPNSPYLKNADKNFPESDEMLVVDSSPYKIRTDTEFNFTVQAGAFGQYENANNLKLKLEKDKLQVKVSPKIVNNLQLHVVTIGKFIDRSDAEGLIETLQKNYSITGRIVKLD
jgi:hypothetical protein